MHVIIMLVLGYLAIIAVVVIGGLIVHAFTSGVTLAIVAILVAAGLLRRLYRAHHRFATRAQNRVNERRVRR